MSLSYLFDPNLQVQDKSGNNNVNGFLRVYIDNTDDRAVTYKDFNGTFNQADIRLDNNGRAVVIVDDTMTYRLEVYDRDGSMLWTAKPLYAIGSNSGGVIPDDIKPLVLKQFGKNLGTYSPLNGNTITIGDSAVHVAVDHANIHAYLTEILADGRTPVLVQSDTDPDTPGVTMDFYFYPTARTGVDSDYSFIGYDGDVVKVATVHDDDTVTYDVIESQSDWNQTDPSAIDFIKNKPFVFIQRLVATYDEVTEAIQSGKIVLTLDGFRYCGTDDNKYFFSKVVETGYYGARIEMSSVDINGDWLTSQSTELLTLDFWNSAFFAYYSVGYHQDIGIYLKDCPLYQASVDATGLSVVQVQNNKFTKVTNFASSTLEIRAELECHDYTSKHAPNFVVEVTPSTACTVTVTTSKNYYDHPHWIPLSSSALTGTTMKANTTYQIRAIGAFWSLFEVDSSGTPSIGDIGQFHAAVTLFNTHVNDHNNPHNVTASQVGAEPAFSVLPVSKGGTGKTTALDAAEYLVSNLRTGTEQITSDDCEIITGSQSAKNPDRFYKRPISTLWNYIKRKLVGATVNVNISDINTDTSSFEFVNGHTYHLTAYLQGAGFSISTSSSGGAYITAYIGRSASDYHYSSIQDVNIQQGVITTNDIRLRVDWKAENITDSSDNKLHIKVVFNGTSYSLVQSNYGLTLKGTDFNGA